MEPALKEGNMFCQKCRVPLRLDASLQDLNPVALNLLLEASSRTLKTEGGFSTTDDSRLLYDSEDKRRYDDAVKDSTGPLMKRNLLPDRDGHERRERTLSGADQPGMSFVMLTESQMGPSSANELPNRGSTQHIPRQKNSRVNGPLPETTDGVLSQRMETTTRLFEILSSRSDVDHPICTECSSMLVEGMEKRLAGATRERDAYAEYLKSAHADLPTDEERRQLEIEALQVQREAENAFRELEDLEREKARLDAELAAVEVEARALDAAEEAFWRERNALAERLREGREERDALAARHAHDARQLERLRRANVWSDTFSIQYDADGFGTINGLRLGRRSGKSVEWAEVNAAWGQALLLLVTVAAKLQYEFRGYRLRPMGSTSRIDKLDDGPLGASSSGAAPAGQQSSQSTHDVAASLELFYSSDLPLSIGFLHRHFDAAMVAFLECLRQLGAHIEQAGDARSRGGGGDGGADSAHARRLPFEIRKDRIGDVSIKLGSFNGDENWTKACKLTLICCKFCLAHASIVDLAKRDGNA